MNKSLKGNKGEVSKKMMIAIAVMIVAIIAIVGAVYLMKNDETRGWNKKLGVIETDEGIKIPLPEGFKKLDITNKINEGIVIEDNDGNQFVWVPVDFAKFKRETFGLDPNQVGYRIILVDKEEDRDVDWEGVLANPGDYQETSGGIWEPTEEKEYKELMESVEKYGGFYIGRYETGDLSKTTVVSEKGNTDIDNQNWYTMYKKQKELYKNSNIMILDEPTSNLDPIAEAKMYDEFNEFSEDKTVIYISHRLASSKFCDNIFFFKDGKLIEQGSHANLINSDGEYSSLYSIQSQYYKS